MNSDQSPKRKMSERISEMAAQFISVGITPEEKQNRLNAACSAWNMACASPEIRRQQLEQYVEGYQRFNPATSPSDLANDRGGRKTRSMGRYGRRFCIPFPDQTIYVGLSHTFNNVP